MALFLIVYGRFRGPAECNEQLSLPGRRGGTHSQFVTRFASTRSAICQTSALKKERIAAFRTGLPTRVKCGCIEA